MPYMAQSSHVTDIESLRADTLLDPLLRLGFMLMLIDGLVRYITTETGDISVVGGVLECCCASSAHTDSGVIVLEQDTSFIASLSRKPALRWKGPRLKQMGPA